MLTDHDIKLLELLIQTEGLDEAERWLLEDFLPQCEKAGILAIKPNDDLKAFFAQKRNKHTIIDKGHKDKIKISS